MSENYSEREQAILKVLKEKHGVEITCSIFELQRTFLRERGWLVSISHLSVEKAAAKIKKYREEYFMTMTREEIEEIINRFVEIGALVRVDKNGDPE